MIEILPESTANVLGIRAAGTVSTHHYDEILNPRIESILNEFGSIKILCVLDEGLPNFEAGYPWDQKGFQLNNKRILPKIAVVGDSMKVKLGVKVIAMSTGSDLKSFPKRKLKQAWDWIKA